MPRRLAALLLALAPASLTAGEVEITGVHAREARGGWTFSVTLRHGDTGWDHYADAWRVKGPDGTVFGTRTLLHPHVQEQPFTRSLSGVRIPEGVTEVVIEARDTVHGWAKTTYPVTLPR